MLAIQSQIALFHHLVMSGGEAKEYVNPFWKESHWPPMDIYTMGGQWDSFQKGFTYSFASPPLMTKWWNNAI